MNAETTKLDSSDGPAEHKRNNFSEAIAAAAQVGMKAESTEFWSSDRLAEHHRQGLAAAIAAGARKAEADYRAQHRGAGAVRARADIRVWRRRPRGYTRHPIELVAVWLASPVALAETNKAVIERLRNKYSPYPVPAGLLTRPIPPGAKHEIQDLLSRSGKSIDLERHSTLSKLKLALRAANSMAGTLDTYRGMIAFTDAAVVIGDKSYAKTQHAHGYERIRVGRQWLRCDVLLELVKSGLHSI